MPSQTSPDQRKRHVTAKWRQLKLRNIFLLLKNFFFVTKTCSDVRFCDGSVSVLCCCPQFLSNKLRSNFTKRSLIFFYAFNKVAAGKPIWATVHSSRAILERPAEICSSIFFQLYWWRKTQGAPSGIISGTSGHLGRTTDLP
jgi:hypothetical protein